MKGDPFGPKQELQTLLLVVYAAFCLTLMALGGLVTLIMEALK